VSKLNEAISRFEEAASIHTAIRCLRLRAESTPTGMAPETQAKRIALISTMCSLLERSRDETIELGILQWEQSKGGTP
jgi:hypothetical protein